MPMSPADQVLLKAVGRQVRWRLCYSSTWSTPFLCPLVRWPLFCDRSMCTEILRTFVTISYSWVHWQRKSSKVWWIPIASLVCSPLGHCSTGKKTRIDRRVIQFSKDGSCDSASFLVDSGGSSLHCLPLVAATEARLPLPRCEERDGEVHIGLPTLCSKKTGTPRLSLGTTWKLG